MRPAGAAEDTIYQYRLSIKCWEKYTENPALEDIDEYAASDFVCGLRAEDDPILADNTIRKHCSQIQAVLNRAGQPRRSDHVTAKILSTVRGWLGHRNSRSKGRKSIHSKSSAKSFSTAEKTPTAMLTPSGLDKKDRPVWWAGLFSWCYLTGLRIGTAIDVERSGFKEIRSRFRAGRTRAAAVDGSRSPPKRGPWPRPLAKSPTVNKYLHGLIREVGFKRYEVGFYTSWDSSRIGYSVFTRSAGLRRPNCLPRHPERHRCCSATLR